MDKVDLFVIGGGSGGVRAARKAAEQGKKVILAEGDKLGGTCVNRGCVPKKLLSYAADFGHHFHNAAGYGWQVDGKPSFSWPTMRESMQTRLDFLSNSYASNLEKSGATVLSSHAKLTGSTSVRCGDREFEAEAILIATGGKPSLPDTLGFAEHACVSDDIFQLDQLPNSAVIVGAGYIAVEFACILAGLDVDVTLVHRGSTVLKNFDISIQKSLIREMKLGGVKLRLNCPLEKVGRDSKNLIVQLKNGDVLNVDLLLCATGRVPNIDGLGLEEAGVETGRGGFIPVDKNYRTNVPTIFAVGDVIDKPALTPVAIAQAMEFVAQRYGGYGPPVNYDLIPTAVFTHPSCGSVGMTEQLSREKYPDCEITETEFSPMIHSLTGSSEKTMMKLIFEKNRGRILGVHMVGPDAGELMQGVAIALAKNATKYDFDAVVGIHPTAAEELVSMR